MTSGVRIRRSSLWLAVWYVLVALLAVLTRPSRAQCSTIEGRYDVVWVIEASSRVNPTAQGFDPFAPIVEFIAGFADSMTMGSEFVRQSFVLFSGPVQGLTNYTTIGDYIELGDPQAASRSAFKAAIRSARVIGGTADVGAALDFVRGTILRPSALRSNSQSIVFLITMGYPTDPTGANSDETVPELAAWRMVADIGTDFFVFRFGGPDLYPPAYFRMEAKGIFDTTILSMKEDLLDTGNLCPVFVEESVLPSTEARCQNLTSADGNSLVVGEVCVGVQRDSFLLEYRVRQGFALTESNSWIGVNPTTIPYAKGGAPLPQQFPFSSSVVSVPVTSLDFGPSCDVYILPRAVVTPVSSSTGVEAFAGEVFFNGGSNAKLFRNNIAECHGFTAGPTQAPTPSPTPTRPGFDFDYIFTTPGVTVEQKAAFTGPTARVSSIFTKDYASFTCFDAGTTICSYVLPQRTCVDDVLVLVAVTAIDGNDGVVAQSGPCVILNQLEQVRVGVIEFDSADFPAILADGRFNATLEHHLMHVIGFGTRWNFWGLISAGPPFTYLGENGRIGFEEVGGTPGSSPEVENTGFHWKKSVFGTELMTPDVVVGETHPFSRMSIMSLRDMGFNVDPNKADPYVIPSPNGRRLLFTPPQHSRGLQSTTDVSDVLVLPLISASWTVKPGRDADLAVELAFAAAHMRTSSPTAADVPRDSSSQVGVIVGSVIGALFLVCVLCALIVTRQRRRSRKPKEKKQDEEKKPREISQQPQTPIGNWQEHTDLDGRTYWVNEDTGEFSWTPPEAMNRVPSRRASNAISGIPRPPPPPPASPRRVLTPGGDTWNEMTDESGNNYWMNEESGEFSWVAPSGKSFVSDRPTSQRINSASFKASPIAHHTASQQEQDNLVPAMEPDSPRVVMVEAPVEEFNDSFDEATADGHGETAQQSDIEAQNNSQLAAPSGEHDGHDDDHHSTYDYSNQSLPNYSGKSQW